MGGEKRNAERVGERLDFNKCPSASALPIKIESLDH